MVHLRNFRMQQGFTQREMADILGVSLSMYEKVERGTIKPSRNFIEKTKRKYPFIDIDHFFFNIEQHQ